MKHMQTNSHSVLLSLQFLFTIQFSFKSTWGSHYFPHYWWHSIKHDVYGSILLCHLWKSKDVLLLNSLRNEQLPHFAICPSRTLVASGQTWPPTGTWDTWWANLTSPLPVGAALSSVSWMLLPLRGISSLCIESGLASGLVLTSRMWHQWCENSKRRP